MFVFVKKKILIFFKKYVDFLWGIVYYNQARFVGQAVKTPPSHGGNTGSIPVRTAFMGNTSMSISLFSFYTGLFTYFYSGGYHGKIY